MYCQLGVIALVHTKVNKVTITVVHKMISITEVQTKVINCNSANKSCLLQVVHTKGIAAQLKRNFAIFSDLLIQVLQ